MKTLYRAWSAIVYSLIPNVKILEKQLNDFCNICAADEIVLFEKATFLVISHISTLDESHYDSHRFERISNIIKQFKISCVKTLSQFQEWRCAIAISVHSMTHSQVTPTSW